MARPREFDLDIALENAITVFWEKGFGDASLPDLLNGMGVTRGSLYKAFKDKRSLYLQVLNTYEKQTVGQAVALLTQEGSDGWDNILSLFASIEEAYAAGDRRGCLLCSAVAGPASFDAEISEVAVQALEKLRVAFGVALEKTDRSNNRTALSHLLLTQYVGLQILCRSSVPLATIQQNLRAIKELAVA